jgi:L-fucose mutarotase
MIKGIRDIISSELLKILQEMGHGGDMLIGDANFPAAGDARDLVRRDGLVELGEKQAFREWAKGVIR